MALAQRRLGGDVRAALQRHRGRPVRDGPSRSPTEGPTIFFLGRHEPRKGLEVLLAATGRAAGRRPGLGGRRRPAERRAARARYGHDPRIEWLGRISDEERAARMRGCTVYCSPSVRGESFGMVLLEAMASGCALVASDLDGHRNVATDGVDALLTPVGDPAALAKALRRVLEEPGLRAELVAGGRRRADQLSMARLAERYAAIYARVAAAGVGPGGRVGPPKQRSPAVTIVLIVVIALVVLIGIYVMGHLQRPRRPAEQGIENGWAQIDVQLRRRYDLIPNLVETVKGYAAHEQETLEAVIQARNIAMAATGTQEQAAAENMITGALKSVFALSEAYPDLKANQNFLALQEELTGHRGPHRLRPAVLQRHGPEVQHQDPDVPGER